MCVCVCVCVSFWAFTSLHCKWKHALQEVSFHVDVTEDLESQEVF